MRQPIQPEDPIPQFESLVQLRAKLHGDGCQRCTLGFQPEINGCCVSRGDITGNSTRMIIGEAPGKEEDAQRSPFTGPAGRLMDQIFAAVGLNTERDFYLSNVVKCRPYSPKGSGKENFTPKAEQQKLCRPYILQEMEILQPHLVVLLGKIAVENILPELKGQRMGDLRGRIIRKGTTIYFIMLHPAAILHASRDPDLELQYKQQTWDDIRALKALMEKENL